MSIRPQDATAGGYAAGSHDGGPDEAPDLGPLPPRTIKASLTFQDADNLTRYRMWPHEVIPDHLQVVAD